MLFFKKSPQGPVTCFYCLGEIRPPPRDEFSFLCSHCDCWNRYDRATKEILSDEPAMHDEDLNASSFARRASLSKNNLPTMYSDVGNADFCRSCQTNQTLIINMLSNYLPPENDPTYPALLAQLPDYTASLHARYPPVCRNCQSVVDEKIRQQDHLARSSVLGARLHASKHRPPLIIRDNWWDVWLWKGRGVLWFASVIMSVCTDALEILGVQSSHYTISAPKLLLLNLLSLFWTFWDPTWLSVRNARIGGREKRVAGREIYIRYQMIIWGARVISSLVLCLAYLQLLPSMDDYPRMRSTVFVASIVVEIILGTLSYSSLNILEPVSIRLTRPPTSASALPATAEPPLFSSLSLDNLPSTSTSAINPIFGLPSLKSAKPIQGKDAAEEMDWTPFESPSSRRDYNFNIKPQRFFAPEPPTGLESLLEKTSLTVNDDAARSPPPSGLTVAGVSALAAKWRTRIIATLVVVSILLVAIAAYVWDTRRLAGRRRQQWEEWERQRQEMIHVLERERDNGAHEWYGDDSL